MKNDDDWVEKSLDASERFRDEIWQVVKRFSDDGDDVIWRGFAFFFISINGDDISPLLNEISSRAESVRAFLLSPESIKDLPPEELIEDDFPECVVLDFRKKPETAR